jgi:hypothetical protein
MDRQEFPYSFETDLYNDKEKSLAYDAYFLSLLPMQQIYAPSPHGGVVVRSNVQETMT